LKEGHEGLEIFRYLSEGKMVGHPEFRCDVGKPLPYTELHNFFYTYIVLGVLLLLLSVRKF